MVIDLISVFLKVMLVTSGICFFFYFISGKADRVMGKVAELEYLIVPSVVLLLFLLFIRAIFN